MATEQAEERKISVLFFSRMLLTGKKSTFRGHCLLSLIVT